MRSPWERPREGEPRPIPAAGEERPSVAPATPPLTTAPGLEASPPLGASGNPPPANPATAGHGPPLSQHLFAIGFALIGGVLGIFGAITQELQAGVLVFLAAGVIEEALKPTGIYILLLRWPHVLLDRLYTASLTAISGLVFGVIEAAVYILLYFPEGGADFVTYRLTAPLVLHAGASFIFGLGIRRELIDWANGVSPFPKDSKRYMVTAMVLHGGFNLTVVILAAAGSLRFEGE